MLAFFEARSIGPMQLCEMVYGRDEKHNTIKGPGQVYAVWNGLEIPSPEKAELWKWKAGLDLTEIVGGLSHLARYPKKAPKKTEPSTAMTPVRRAVALHEKAMKEKPAKAPPVLSAKAPSPAPRGAADPLFPPPLFALNIGQDGRSHVTLNLLDISSEEALRVMATLSAANLIKAKS